MSQRVAFWQEIEAYLGKVNFSRTCQVTQRIIDELSHLSEREKRAHSDQLLKYQNNRDIKGVRTLLTQLIPSKELIKVLEANLRVPAEIIGKYF